MQGDFGSCAAGVRADAVRVDELLDAAWKALIAGRPEEYCVLELMLERPVEVPRGTEADWEAMQASMRSLELLIAATARNLRVLRGAGRTN